MNPYRRACSVAAASAVLLGVIVPAWSQTFTNVPALWRLARGAHAREVREKTEAVKLAHRWGLPTRMIDEWTAGEVMRVSAGWLDYRRTLNLEAAQTISTDKVWPGGAAGLALSGSPIILGIWDASQVRLTHQEFTGRAIPKDSETMSSSHPTAVGGTMIAAGVVPNAKGMSFAGTLWSYGWTDDTAEMAAAAANGLRISNHSYGVWGQAWQFGFYDPYSQEFDQLAYDAPFYLIVEAAGNSQGANGKGPYDTIIIPATAKNSLAVGAVSAISGGYTGNPSSIQLAGFSSCGPTDDGRIKPDVLGCGVSVYTLTYSSDTSYGTWSGTSFSSPNVAGSAALLIQHYRNTHGGSDMRSATLKGLIIHTADHPYTPAPDYRMGWGLVNTFSAASTITRQLTAPLTIQEAVLSSGGTSSFKVASLGTSPLKVTISWTDPPGTPPPTGVADPTALMLVNDLDLRISRNGMTYSPWVLDPANPSAPATTGDNFRDNVEQVYLPAPAPGVYTVTVTHKGAALLPSGTQAFSTIVTGQSQWLAGSVLLQDYVGPIGSIPVTVDFRQPGTTTVVESHVVNLDSNGGFAIPTGLLGTYDVAFKASHWLRKVVKGVVLSDSGATGLVVSLPNGDVNGDNTINLADLNAISAAWRSTSGASNWNPNADLNGDGTVNLMDWNIVSKNWRLSGDP